MSGISCLVNFKNNLTKNIPYYDLLIRQINGTASNGSSWICEQAVLFSECTLSKICEGYQFTIAFSGNISNSHSLKKDLSAFGYHFLTDKDAEIALSAYIHFGEKCGETLCGEFSFIVYDAMRRQIFALSSHGTAMPVFYANINGDYVLSSSLKGILSHPDISRRISDKSVLELLSCQNSISSCIFEDVYMLPAGSFLKISKSGIKMCSYINPDASFKDDISNIKSAGVILSGTAPDFDILERLEPFCRKEHTRASIYAEKFSDDLCKFSTRNQHLLTDDGTVLWALETTVSACGFPFLSSYDFLLPIVLKQAKGTDETFFFAFPDRYYSAKNYVSTLVKNNAFYKPIEENIKNYNPHSDILPPYPSLISGAFETTIKVLPAVSSIYNEETLTHTVSGRIKTALRHILLDIISKEHSPIIAFFKRSALLRLCEGGFTFSENEDESQLIAYLIKLNMWFELYRPRII